MEDLTAADFPEEVSEASEEVTSEEAVHPDAGDTDVSRLHI